MAILHVDILRVSIISLFSFQARKAHSFHQDGDRKVRPQRPPPPKKNVRDRTNAMSLVLDSDINGRLITTRHSTPDLCREPPIATLVALDEDSPTKEQVGVVMDGRGC